jgi:putative transposase
MTLPRQVVPGCDYMITRRCSERRFFLRPDDDTNNAFIYCLALAAKRANVDVTFSVAMSNHHHTGIHDPAGNFPIFTEHFHGLLARCQNANLGRFENFWSSESTSVVRLVEPNDILDKMTYAFTNPSAAGLVDTVEAWPGVATFRATISGGHVTATRPKHFFRDDGGMPEIVSLKIARPHGFEALGQDEWGHLVTERVRNKEAEHRQRRADKDIAVLGRAGILAQNPFHCPEGHAPRFNLIRAWPRKASGHASKRFCATVPSSSGTGKRSRTTWQAWQTSCFRSEPSGCASSARLPARLPRQLRRQSSVHTWIPPPRSWARSRSRNGH